MVETSVEDITTLGFKISQFQVNTFEALFEFPKLSVKELPGTDIIIVSEKTGVILAEYKLLLPSKLLIKDDKSKPLLFTTLISLITKVSTFLSKAKDTSIKDSLFVELLSCVEVMVIFGALLSYSHENDKLPDVLSIVFCNPLPVVINSVVEIVIDAEVGIIVSTLIEN